MTFYVSTPIYYVNDRPHIGHLYSTVVADVLARFHRQRGRAVLLSTGTDEHALKVADAAHAAGRTPADFAAEHAEAFRDAFAQFRVSHDQFLRTSEAHHQQEVAQVCERLLATGDIYAGKFTGWYDAAAEEYVPDARAAAAGYRASNGHALIRRSEDNYFFRLSRFQSRLRDIVANDELCITPAVRRAEVLARLDEPLRDVPISRRTPSEWGVLVPGTQDHRVYVWVDALLHYRTVARVTARSGDQPAWPPSLHLIGKEILWFHAVLWPALLLALRDAGDRLTALPERIHAHSHFTACGRKISKSLGNAVTLKRLCSLSVGPGDLDGVRYFFAARGPLGASDSDFDRREFLRVYNAELANGLGNALSRTLGLITRHFDGRVPAFASSESLAADLCAVCEAAESEAYLAVGDLDLAGFVRAAQSIVKRVNGVFQGTEPYRLVREAAQLPRAGSILRSCLEALVFACDLLAPVTPVINDYVRQALGIAGDPGTPRWGTLTTGAELRRIEALFPRLE